MTSGTGCEYSVMISLQRESKLESIEYVKEHDIIFEKDIQIEVSWCLHTWRAPIGHVNFPYQPRT